MLYIQPHQNKTAFPETFKLAGDYDSLRSLHDTLHKVVGRTPENPSTDFALGLAYEVRKAYEGQRETDSLESLTYYKTELCVPYLLLQMRYFRWLMTQQGASSYRDQANLFTLEASVEEALQPYCNPDEVFRLLNWPIAWLHNAQSRDLAMLYQQVETDWTKRRRRSASTLIALLSATNASRMETTLRFLD